MHWNERLHVKLCLAWQLIALDDSFMDPMADIRHSTLRLWRGRKRRVLPNNLSCQFSHVCISCENWGHASCSARHDIYGKFWRREIFITWIFQSHFPSFSFRVSLLIIFFVRLSKLHVELQKVVTSKIRWYMTKRFRDVSEADIVFEYWRVGGLYCLSGSKWLITDVLQGQYWPREIDNLIEFYRFLRPTLA